MSSIILWLVRSSFFGHAIAGAMLWLCTDADLQALVDAGRGDVPRLEMRFRCSNFGSRLTDFVVTGSEATGRLR